jgi:hypothetical protein
MAFRAVCEAKHGWANDLLNRSRELRNKLWQTFLAEVDTYRRQNVYHDLCGRDTPSYQAELERDLDQAL